jgi:lipopolysaccharide/colanic/teichoic acid biosynthesis glycosyltransferase
VLNELDFNDVPYIETSHDSFAKHVANAELSKHFSTYAMLVSRMAAMTLSSMGYNAFYQVRVGKGLEPFYMPKLQTMDSINEPHILENKQNLHPVADFVRRFGLDELVQTTLVSNNPHEPGLMSLVGHRPQTPEELDDMEWAMARAGESARFNTWLYEIYSSQLPGVIGVESFLDNMYEPHTYEYFSKRIELGEWYHQHGSPYADLQILGDTISMGSAGLAHYIFERQYSNE